ncbi:hypothetical protein C3U77_000151 [Escherichia coli]|uniref:hypothetical protein n=1 Tax=Escherichia coli TaxID=562 RepID=UPI000D13235C|nr:hypothetical protein [Escherichia coli]EED1399986.1 hypothetical protein [Escherichia coli]EEW5070762.1 hypothetical protein [Escherichia coli]EEZ5177672.1 hypothetical protein [Escherichia coli]EFA7760399.1 hypothetical protein [Escherichia coli]EFA7784740.1 hypothetical protein [Escherichia coli]
MRSENNKPVYWNTEEKPETVNMYQINAVAWYNFRQVIICSGFDGKSVEEAKEKARKHAANNNYYEFEIISVINLGPIATN